MFLRFIRVTSVVLCGLIIFSCGGPTDPEQGIIMGSVQLESQSDHSGIEVMLFSGGLVPDEIKLINNQHPNVGRILSDQDVFDHRLYNVLHTTFTDSNGDYTFPKVPFDQYIIVYRKANWGYNYLYDVQLDQDNVELETKWLYNEIQIPNLIDGVYEILPGKTYRISSNVITTETSVLWFHPGANVIFDSQTKLSINGSVQTTRDNDLSATLTSSHNIYAQQGTTQYSGTVEITSLSNVDSVSNLRVCWLHDGIINNKSNISIQNSFFAHNLFSIQSHDVSQIDISGSVFASNSDDEGVAIYLNRITGINIHDNIFYDNANSIHQEICNEATINNNAFVSGIKEVQNMYESNCLLTQNLFRNSVIPVTNTGISNLDIRYNDFDTHKCIVANETDNWHNTATTGWTKANYNNFKATEIAVEISCVYLTHGGQPIALDFTQNYWSTSSSAEISNMILDSNDYNTPPPGSGWNWGLVDYQPFRSQSVATAGIQ